MGFFTELFRVEDWRREPLVISVPLVTFFVTVIFATVVFIVVEWPTDSWRTLFTLLSGTFAASVARWVVLHRQRSLASSIEIM